MTRTTSAIAGALAPVRVSDEVSALFDRRPQSAEVEVPRRGLDTMMLQIEMPRSASEVTELAPAKTRKWWRQVLLWDLLFVAGYFLLFTGLAVNESGAATLWERPTICIVVTGITDMVENLLLLEILNYLDAGLAIAGRRTLLALLIISALKWLLYFLSVRALSINLEKLDRWRVVAVVLRAAATGGSWTAILVLLGLPARPLLSLMTVITFAALGAATMMRLLPPVRPREPISA
ncbi:MAG TPA: hypothetical protein VF883_18515 [Thermoanaerobaculia bacterium]|jgi:hypothetical protein